MTFYTTEKISDTRELTPEGFLLCRDVVLARTGTMEYYRYELPPDVVGSGNKNDVILIYRSPEEVFAPESIASANGKPVVNNHPEDSVGPSNWNYLALGVIMYPRQEADTLIADLLITSQQGIDLVNKGKTQLSCGYDADYTKTGMFEGEQSNIRINHVAFVDAGRCGQLCSIGDSRMATKSEEEEKEVEMKDDDKESEEKKSEEKESEEKEVKDSAKAFTDDDIQAHIDQNAKEHEEMMSRIKALEAKLNTKDDDSKGKEENTMDESEVLADAEVLVPGIAAPTKDCSMDEFKMKTLRQFYATQDGRPIMDTFLDGKKLGKLTSDALGILFNAVVALKGALNTESHSSVPVLPTGKRPMTLAEINEYNAKLWGPK